MSRLSVACVLCLSAAAAIAGVPASGNETPAAEQATAAVPVPQAAAAGGQKEFKPPSGFLPKKRGAVVLYCKKDTTVGTRFKTEKCYSEAQMRDYIVAQQENKRDIDRIRNTCSTGVGDFCRHP